MFVCVVEPGSVPTFLPVLHIKGPGVTASIWSSSHLRYLTLQWQVIKHTHYPSCNTGWPEGNEKGTNRHTHSHRHKHSKAGFFHWHCTIYCMVWKSMRHYSYALGALTAALRVEILYWSPSQRTHCQHQVSGEAAENFTVSTTCHFDIKSYLKRHGRVVRKQSFSHRSVMFTPALRMWAFSAIFSWITGVATQRKPSYQCGWRRRRSQSLCARLHIQRQTMAETTPDFCHFS